MEEQKNVQQQLFDQVEAQLPANVSLVDEVADRLGISTDSAYRRIRGEKRLDIMELQQLCAAYELSADALFNVRAKNVNFQYNALDPEDFNFEDYLRSILADLEQLAAFRDKQVIYAANDITIFQALQVPEIAAFKFFFWKKTTLGFPELKDKKFALQELEPAMAKLRWKLLDAFTKVPVTEILYINAITSTLKQVEFYWESGLFEQSKDAAILCDKMEALVHHMQQEAELGFNFIYGQPPKGQEGTYQLYYNEVILIGDAVLVKTEEGSTAYVTNNAINILKTTDPGFYANTEQYLKNLMSKSILISSVSERERNKFFMRIQRKIKQLKDRVLQEKEVL